MAKAKVYLRRLGPVGVLAVIAASLPAIGGFALLGSMAWTGPWLKAQGEWGVVIYIGAFAVLAGLAVLPTYAQAVVGGFAFGLAVGGPAAISGFAGAAMIGYLIAWRASGNRVMEIIKEQPKWQAVYDALLRSGRFKALLIVTLIRIPPNSPFAITNLVMAATRVRPLTYLIGTVVGMAPRTIAAAYIGSGLKDLDFANPYKSWMFIITVVITVIVVGIIGSIANKAVAKVTLGPNTPNHPRN
ncbi:MAG: TVP38/TMEM64 family protein [Phycisphaerales bacterium]|nr:TVP38/TMEM64 family protein [Phycisphaerales bacterium]